MEPKKHNKKDYESKCPNCGSEDISEVTGWCYNHDCPETSSQDLIYCGDKHEGGELIVKVENAYFCNNCDYLFDKEKMVDFDEYHMHGCPVGEEYDPTEFFDEDPEEYTEGLLELMSEFSEDRLDNCLKDGYIIEAIVMLQRRIAEQIRIILIRKIRREQMLKPSNVDDRYKRIVPFLKDLRDFALNEMAFIHDIINKDQLKKINALNTLRNKISHAFNLPDINKYSDRNKLSIISEAKNISQLLDKVVFGQQ